MRKMEDYSRFPQLTAQPRHPTVEPFELEMVRNDGADLTLWRLIGDEILQFFDKDRSCFVLSNYENRAFRFLFLSSDEENIPAILQVTEVMEGAVLSSNGVNKRERMVWRMPLISHRERGDCVDAKLHAHLYPISPRDFVLLRQLFLKDPREILRSIVTA